ncbi:right-handed parallel beta-helix repeat-containing protein, partial [Candidatus Sumerlaeota bacterium]|nr:right-handed parallel beta-helix repeat-containing protein [Candidatus Sumerlaeota bacterium]
AGSGIFLEDVNSGMVKDNDVSGCGSAGMELTRCSGLLVTSNILSKNRVGLRITPRREGAPIIIKDNLFLNNESYGIEVLGREPEISGSIKIGENAFSGNGGESIYRTP